MFTQNTQRNGGSAGTSIPNNCSAVAGMLLGVCLMFTTPLVADTIYVDDDAPPAGDGASWNSAFRFLQDGIAASQLGDTIRIAQGVYKPDRSEAAPDGTGDREASFHIVSNTIIEGGYAGLGASDPDARDPEQFETILSGDLNGNDEGGFINYEDNSYTVVLATNGPGAVTIDGVTITAGNASEEEDEAIPASFSHGGGIFADSVHLDVRRCMIRQNDADWGSGITIINSPEAQIAECTFQNNHSQQVGGAMRIVGATTASVADCLFDSNSSTGVAGAVRADDCEALVLENIQFVGNTAGVGGGAAMFSAISSFYLLQCNFIENQCSVTGGAFALGVSSLAEISHCNFSRNDGGILGGAIVSASPVNCTNSLFVQNTAGLGGGVHIYTESASIFNGCTIAHNAGGGINIGNGWNSSSDITVQNCVLWGNSIGPLLDFGGLPFGGSGQYTVTNSNIQGGWPGVGNIDADPLFVQPGTLNYGLAYGSPCLNTGNNADLPPDSFDLDGDGDLTEPLPIDLVGNPRIIDEIVDMGALEGASEMLPPAAGDFDFDPGEFTFLIPSLQEFNPLQHTAAFVINSSDSDNETVIFTDLSDSANGESGSGSNIHLLLETSLNDGEISAYLYAPITAADLDPDDPLGADLVIIDPASGDRLLATALNVEHNSHTGEPIGRRFVSTDAEDWQNTFTVGDYGIVWDEITQQGFVWANVDVAGEFQLRQSTCPGDCFPSGGNEAVNIGDLLELLGFWSYEHRWCDFNEDGIVDAADLTILLEHWGICSP